MMGKVTINRETEDATTAVSNIFIDEYMGDANDAQIKIYLYLVRMLQADAPTSVTALADKFNHTEKDVMRALRYWEKRSLLRLEYDGARHLTGIHIEDLPLAAAPEKAPDEAPADIPSKPAKPRYSSAQLASFREDAECAQLIYIAEQYFARPLNSSEIRTLLYIYSELHFSADLMDYLLQYCAGRGKSDFRYLEKVAIGWHQEGIRTPKEAKQLTYKYDQRIYDIMKALGMENAPTATEIAFFNRWLSEYMFSMEIIMEACARTVLSTQKNRLKYADSILKSWHENGVLKPEDIHRLDEAHTDQRSVKKPPRQTGAVTDQKNRFNRFPQRDYDFEALEKQLLSN